MKYSPEDDVSPLRVRGDGAGDGGEAVGVDDGLLTMHPLGQLRLQTQVDVYGDEGPHGQQSTTVPRLT